MPQPQTDCGNQPILNRDTRPYIGRSKQFKRSKNGCLGCRHRKKKCDEARPRCVGCRRKNIECIWPMDQDETPTTTSPLASSSVGSPTEECPSGGGGSSTLGTTDTSTAATIWSASLGSFLDSRRSCALTPASPLLLQHYISTTATMLPMPLKENAFLSQIIPVASMDDMVMHSILAVSGAHMNFENTSPKPIQLAILGHYSSLVRQLVIEASDLRALCVDRLARLLLILVMLCHFEVGILNLYSQYTLIHC